MVIDGMIDQQLLPWFLPVVFAPEENILYRFGQLLIASTVVEILVVNGTCGVASNGTTRQRVLQFDLSHTFGVTEESNAYCTTNVVGTNVPGIVNLIFYIHTKYQ